MSLCCLEHLEFVHKIYNFLKIRKKICMLHNKKLAVKKMLGNKPSYSTISLDIFRYVNHNIDIGLQYTDTVLSEVKRRVLQSMFNSFAALAEG